MKNKLRSPRARYFRAAGGLILSVRLEYGKKQKFRTDC